MLRLGYRWVAGDLDSAVSYLGHSVRREFDRELETLRKQKNPDVQTTGKRSKPRKHEPVTDTELEELHQTVVGRIVYGKVVLFVDGVGAMAAIRASLTDRGVQPRRKGKDDEPAPVMAYKKPPRWRVEKPITGDPMIDRTPHKGERSVFDENGQLLRRYGPDGDLIWSRPADE